MKYIEPWLPYPHTLENEPGNRTRENYTAVVKQFSVETNPRYTPRDINKDGTQDTFCNIFLWDVTCALHCEIPHWVLANGARAAVGMGRETSANGVVDWMREHGTAAGWRQLTEDEARGAAAQGYPTVVLWQHHGGIGHVAVVMPGPNDVTQIAQAGANNYECRPISYGFGRLKEPALRFWMHE